MTDWDEATVTVSQEFDFHAAHLLVWHPGKCARLHGHTYRVQVDVDGDLDHRGIVIDFDELSDLVWTKVLEPLDHSFLNDVMENPTAERIALHVMRESDRFGLLLSEVRVWETPRSFATARRRAR